MPAPPHLAATPRGAIKLFGRGGSALASLGLARYKSRAPLTRRLPPCRPLSPHATVCSGRLGEASLPANLLVGAALRADRTRPYETDALERRPYQRTNLVGARLTPLATLLRNARFARGICTRPPTCKYGRGAIAFSFAPLPQLSHAPDFFISCGACRSGRLGKASLPANQPGRGASHPSSDIASQCSLRSGDMTRPLTPCRPSSPHATVRNGRLGKASLPTPPPQKQTRGVSAAGLFYSNQAFA